MMWCYGITKYEMISKACVYNLLSSIKELADHAVLNAKGRL